MNFLAGPIKGRKPGSGGRGLGDLLLNVYRVLLQLMKKFSKHTVALATQHCKCI